MNIGTISYLPPESFELAHAFRNNLAAFKSSHPVHLFSNDDSWGVKYRCPNPDIARTRNWFCISNYVFICALCVADKLGLEYFLYLECDSGVNGDGWDGKMFDEHFSYKDALLSGTPCLWNSHGAGNASLARTVEYAHAYNAKSVSPMLIMGRGQPHERPGVCLYPNGSVAIYHTQTLKRIFPDYHDPLRQALAITAWDVAVGQGLWSQFGMVVFDKVAPLTCSFSGCTDSFMTEDDRVKLLREKRVVAIHQLKKPSSFQLIA